MEVARNTSDVEHDQPVVLVNWLLGWANVQQPSGVLKIAAGAAEPGDATEYVLWYFPEDGSMKLQLTEAEANIPEWTYNPEGR